MKWNRSGKSVLTTIIVLSSDEVMNNEKLERIYEPNLMIGANFWWTVEKRVMAIAFCSLPMRFVWRHEKFWSVVRSLATTQQWTVDEDNVFDDDPFTRPTEQSFIVTHLLIIQSFWWAFFFKVGPCKSALLQFESISHQLATKPITERVTKTLESFKMKQSLSIKWSNNQ